jgi:Flp pilus assembly protein TadG
MNFQKRHHHTTFERMLSDARGATAIEFALVALPFFALLGAIIQVAFMIWAQQNLDFVFQKAIRTVFTGTFQQKYSQSLPTATLLADLQATMCGSSSAPMAVVFNCSAVKIDLTLGTNFTSSTPVYPVNATTKDWNSGFGTNYTCAAPGTIVVATAAVKFPVFFGLLNAGLANFADGSKLLMATSVFRTEPYATAGTSPC